MYICKKCGSSEIKVAAWVSPNDHTQIDFVKSIPQIQDVWCDKCKTKTTLAQSRKKIASFSPVTSDPLDENISIRELPPDIEPIPIPED